MNMKDCSEADPWINEEHEYEDMLQSLEQIAKEMMPRDWENAFDEDTMDDDELIELLRNQLGKSALNKMSLANTFRLFSNNSFDQFI
jgi:hypothetical protein